MTSGKAANCLGYARSLLINKREMHIGSDIDNAFYIAIKMLEQQPCEDAISRSEAIRVASGYCHWTNIPEELAKLPSVNPKPCEDAISRQAVLDLLQEEREEVHITSEAITKIRIAEINVEDLKAIPSVTPAPKNVNDVLDAIKADLQTLADDEWNQQVMASKGLEFAIEIIENYQMAMMEEVEETETCKGCTNKCIMYDPNMKGCKDKMEGAEDWRGR